MDQTLTKKKPDLIYKPKRAYTCHMCKKVSLCRTIPDNMVMSPLDETMTCLDCMYNMVKVGLTNGWTEYDHDMILSMYDNSFWGCDIEDVVGSAEDYPPFYCKRCGTFTHWKYDATYYCSYKCLKKLGLI